MNKATLIVQATSICNCNCAYCYDYPRRGGNKIMPLDVLEAVIQKAFRQRIKRFLWHGGEPVLAGINFYETVLQLQDKYYVEKPENLIQTNGVCLDETMCDFLLNNDFRLGVSIDGVNENANIFRYGCKAKELTKVVVDLIDRNLSNDIPMGVLVVLHEHSLPFLSDLYDHFVGSKCVIKFAPVINIGKARGSTNFPAGAISMGPLLPLLTRYMQDDTKVFSVNTFDEAINVVYGKANRSCVFSKSCVGKFFCVTTEGDIFPCSRTAGNEKYFLGNIIVSDFQESLDKLLAFPGYLSCDSDEKDKNLLNYLVKYIHKYNQIRPILSADMDSFYSVNATRDVVRHSSQYIFSSQDGRHNDYSDYVAYSDAVYFENNQEWLEDVSKSRFDLHALLLYTEADVHICQWAKGHGELLHELSGQFCRIMVPVIAALPKQISTLLVSDLKNDENRSIFYARMLGIKETKIPCFAFFDKNNCENIVVYCIDPTWDEAQLTHVMKNIFANVYAARNNLNISENYFDILMKKLKKDRVGIVIKRKIDKSSIFDLLKLFVPFLK